MVTIRSSCARFLFAGGIVMVAAVAVEFCAAEARPSPVTRQEVWQAVVAGLRERGVAEAQLPRSENIDLPVALPALEGRSLRVVSVCRDAGLGRTQFRLECGAAGQCLPFLVYVHEAENADGAVRAAWCRVPASRRAGGPSLKPLMRAGDRATAVFAAAGLRMAASVTCLERGGEGDVIRVRSADGHIFRARISGPALLEAVPR